MQVTGHPVTLGQHLPLRPGGGQFSLGVQAVGDVPEYH